MNIWIGRIPQEEEIKTMINKMNADWDPEPDGFFVKIFQVLWTIMKDDIMAWLTHLFLG